MERFVCDPTWPNDLILDPDVGNWCFWSFKMRICADKTGVHAWLNGTQPRPDLVLYPKAHRIWETTDLSLRAFIIEHISPSIIDEVLSLDTAYEVYEHLRKHHERQGLYTQLLLLKEALEIRFNPDVSLTVTLTELNQAYNNIISMGDIDNEKLHSVLIINALGDQFSTLQSAIQAMTEEPGYTPDKLIRRIRAEQALHRNRARVGLQTAGATALAATTSSSRDRNVVCSNCKRANHTIDFCIRPGGKMAGQTIEEARAAQRTASGKPPRSTPGNRSGQSAHVATTNQTPPATTTTMTNTTSSSTRPQPPKQIMLNGASYVLSTQTVPSRPNRVISLRS
jgi:phosphohistidine phosphatase SixA